MNERTTIGFDAAKVERLRVAYNEARKRRADEFTFEGNMFVTDYAKYLLEYLDNRFCARMRRMTVIHRMFYVRRDGQSV